MSNRTGKREDFAAEERVSALQGDLEMFTVSVLYEPSAATGAVREPAAVVSSQDADGHAEGQSLSTQEAPCVQGSLSSPEELPASEPPCDTLPDSEPWKKSPDQLDEPVDPHVAGHEAESSEAHDDLKHQVAEQQREIETLRKMLQVSADVIQTIPTGLFLFQYQPPGELFFLNCNPEATRLTGLEQEDCRGVELDEIWLNARGQGLTKAFLDAARTGKPFEAGKALYRNSRAERVFRVKAFSLPGERLGVAFLDLTDQKRAEEAMREAQDALDTRRADETSESVSRHQHVESEGSRIGRSHELALESCRLAAQEELAGHAARLLSHPMESLQESARRALARLESGYISLVRASLKQIQQSASQVSSVVTQLRQFARISPATCLPQGKALDLSKIVRESVEAVRSGLDGDDGKNVTPAVQELILGHDCYVKGESSEFLDVVNTLLKNALEATHRRGRVTVKSFSDEDWVVLEVGDDGEGIPEDDVSRVFEPFWTSKSSHTGLGLAAVSGVIRRYGGDVRVSTERWPRNYDNGQIAPGGQPVTVCVTHWLGIILIESGSFNAPRCKRAGRGASSSCSRVSG